MLATDSGLQQTLVMHWDGSGWNPVASPNPGNHNQDENQLLGMGSSAAGDVWTAGSDGSHMFAAPVPAVPDATGTKANGTPCITE